MPGLRCLLLLFLPVLLAVSVQAQNSPFASPIEALTADTQLRAPDGSMQDAVRCGVPNPTDEQMQAIEAEITRMRAIKGDDFGVRGSVVIPVAFHIVRSGTSINQGNVPQSRIDDQLDVLNAAFASTNFQFSLDRVTRTTNSTWFNGCAGSSENTMKSALNVDPATTLNFYSCNPGGLLGFATFPNFYPESDFRHGVVVLHSSFPGGSAFPYDEGDTGTHEVGHYLGLFHTFQGGCFGSGDQVSDTAPEASPAFGCPIGRDTCSGGGPDPIRNFMDYVDDDCMNEFTPGQSARMDAQVATFKPTLLLGSSGNGEATVSVEQTGGFFVGGSGGTVSADFEFSNNSGSTFTGEWWVQVEFPNGSPGPTLGPFALTLNNGQTTTLSRSRGVPGSAPSGTYTVTGYVGEAFPNEDDSDSFTFLKGSNLVGGDESLPMIDGPTWTEGDGVSSDVMNPASAQATVGLDVYPTPFSGRTTVRYTLDEVAEARLAVYDVLGRRVALLAHGIVEAGEHEATFEATDLPSGVYLVRFETAGRVETQQITLMK